MYKTSYCLGSKLAKCPRAIDIHATVNERTQINDLIS